jgi:ethanolamine utilization protein EutM
MNKAIGLIEVEGYGTAITIADTVLKVAAVDLIGIQRAKGQGWMTVGVTGDVGAVKAAVDAGKAKAIEVGGLVSSLVIPRAADSLDKIVIDKVDYPAPKAQVSISIDTNKQNSKNTVESKENSEQENQKKLSNTPDVKIESEEPVGKKDTKENNKPETPAGKKDTKK